VFSCAITLLGVPVLVVSGFQVVWFGLAEYEALQADENLSSAIDAVRIATFNQGCYHSLRTCSRVLDFGFHFCVLLPDQVPSKLRHTCDKKQSAMLVCVTNYGIVPSLLHRGWGAADSRRNGSLAAEGGTDSPRAGA
jgi:hypothetical protein